MTYDTLKIGDLVTLKSHAYTENIATIIITGDPTSLPPIMIIKEIRKINKEKESHLIFTCIWFSNKSNTLQEAKFKDFHLKQIVLSEQKKQDQSVINEGDMVLLKSTELELKKRKSTFSSEESSTSTNNTKNTLSALLSYLPPIFHVISIKDHNKTADAKSVEKGTYWCYTKKVKCFYHNGHTDKISEVELPLEALDILQPFPEKILEDINNIISRKHYIFYGKENKEILILQPKQFSFRSGFYFLSAFNIIDNKNVEINITSGSKYKEIEKIVKTSSPTSDMPNFNKKEIAEDMAIKIKQASDENLYIRIRYRNKYDEATTRTISGYELQDNTSANEINSYLTGYCHLRMDKRTFMIERIQYLEILNIKF